MGKKIKIIKINIFKNNSKKIVKQKIATRWDSNPN